MNRAVIVLCLLAVGVALGIAREATAGRMVFEETVIEGEVRKPEVVVYISRQNLEDRYQLELRESFLPKIVEAVRHPPF